MRKEFEHLALLAGGSHYPQVGGDNLELFGKLLVRGLSTMNVPNGKMATMQH